VKIKGDTGKSGVIQDLSLQINSMIRAGGLAIKASVDHTFVIQGIKQCVQ
jgi:hypothetical protein